MVTGRGVDGSSRAARTLRRHPATLSRGGSHFSHAGWSKGDDRFATTATATAAPHLACTSDESGARRATTAGAHRTLADVQQRADRAEGGRRDPDQAPIDTASEQRERGGELYDAQDDGDPSPRVEAREHVLRVIDEEIRKP